jgi:hypothetical protein
MRRSRLRDARRSALLAGADGKPRTDLPFKPVMLDNLIDQRRIPSIVAVLLSPGPGGQRTIEYDTVSTAM